MCQTEKVFQTNKSPRVLLRGGEAAERRAEAGGQEENAMLPEETEQEEEEEEEEKNNYDLLNPAKFSVPLLIPESKQKTNETNKQTKTKNRIVPHKYLVCFVNI